MCIYKKEFNVMFFSAESAEIRFVEIERFVQVEGRLVEFSRNRHCLLFFIIMSSKKLMIFDMKLYSLYETHPNEHFIFFNLSDKLKHVSFPFKIFT